MPAAPLVGAVTTCPPAAFSSLTASAQALTHSIGSTGPSGVSASSSRFRRGARRGTLSTPGSMPSAANPRRTQACMTFQMRIELRVDLGVASHRALVDAHQPVDREAGARALREQFLAVGEGQRNLHGRAGAGPGFRFALALHGAAADRVHLFRQQRLSRRVPRGESHAIGVSRQHLVAVEQEVHRLVEGDLVPAGEPDAAACRGCARASAPSPRGRIRTGRGPRGRAGSPGPCSGRGRSAPGIHRAARRLPRCVRAGPSPRGRVTKKRAASIGPIVCDDDGPTPTLKTSKVDRFTGPPGAAG